MPPLKRPEKASIVTLPPRRALMAARTDILVVGGGPAGLGAALGAARAGAEVILCEQYGFLGGNATAALVNPFVSYYTQHHRRETPGAINFFPTDHGPGDPVISGVLADMVARLVRVGGIIPPSPETAYTVPFDPEAFKTVADDMIDEAGVRLLLHCFASDVFGRRPYPGYFRDQVRARSDHGTADHRLHWRRRYRRPGGCPFEVGREEDGLVQPMTLYFRMVEFRKASFRAYVKKHPDQWLGSTACGTSSERPKRRRARSAPRGHPLFGTPHETAGASTVRGSSRYWGPMWRTSPVPKWKAGAEPEDRDVHEKQCRASKKSYMVQSGATVGVRSPGESSDYRITSKHTRGGEVRRCHRPGNLPVDLHNPEGKGTVLVYLPGESYDIPLRSLLPQGFDNLLVAGRCISGSHEAHSSYRVMPICMATGQAAGACAALASRNPRSVREVPAHDVQQELIRQGANLGRDRF